MKALVLRQLQRYNAHKIDPNYTLPNCVYVLPSDHVTILEAAALPELWVLQWRLHADALHN